MKIISTSLEWALKAGIMNKSANKQDSVTIYYYYLFIRGLLVAISVSPIHLQLTRDQRASVAPQSHQPYSEVVCVILWGMLIFARALSYVRKS